MWLIIVFREIAAHLESILYPGDDNEPNSSQCKASGMSLMDKMGMWDRKASVVDTEVEKDDFFSGVKDAEEEDIEPATLPAYIKTVLDSSSYEWFIASLKKQLLLQLNAMQPHNTVEAIRQRILEKLPTGSISKKHAPYAHTVTFDIDWQEAMEKRLRNEVLEPSLRSSGSLFDYMTVTGSPDEAQALTIRQYMNQTWPANGLQLLDILQGMLTSSNGHYSGEILNPH